MFVYRDGLEVDVKSAPKVVVRAGHTCEVFELTQGGKMWFVTLKDTAFCAHGESFHDAVTAAKEKQTPGSGKAEALARVRKSGVIGLSEFCAITTACRAGATAWANANNVSIRKKLPVKTVIEMLKKTSSASWGESLANALKEKQ